MSVDLYTVAQSQEIDRHIIAAGIPGIVLMKRAARAALDVLCAQWPEITDITVLCGGGNNAGDGYLLATLAAERGLSARIIAVVAREHLKGDAVIAAQQARISSVPWTMWGEHDEWPDAGVLVDALLGTGTKGVLRNNYADLITAINESALPVLSLDVPSGLAADTGCVDSVAVDADVTVTFIVNKQGLFTGCAKDYCGQIICASLDVETCSTPVISESHLLDLDSLRCQFLHPRPRTAHKGAFGSVMVIGGDKGMGGAVILAAEAAARTGAGLTRVATQPEHVSAVLARRPEVMACGVTSGQELEPLLARASVLVVGPGLGRTAWSEQMLQQATLCGVPLVLDADGLNILAQGLVVRASCRADWVLTPHPAEAARLLNIETADVQRDRFSAARALQARYGGVIVLKGAGTIVCGKDGGLAVCTGGNPGMATGGMGDVLAGMIGGLIAQGVPLQSAAELAVCMHAAAADDLSRTYGERGLLAGDMLPCLSRYLNIQP